MPSPMTREEALHFLLHGTRTGKLATVRPDGRPHVAPIWFTMEGETLFFMTGETSVKGKNILRDPRVSIAVDEEQPPYAFAIVEGRASISHDAQEMRHWATRIGGRYMGQDQAEAYGKRNSAPGGMLVRVVLNKIVAEKNIAD